MIDLHKKILALLFIFASIFALYYPSINYPFMGDDCPNIVRNEHLKLPVLKRVSFFINREATSSAEHIQFHVYRPVSSLAYSFILQFFGGKSSTFHLVNILMHSLNSALIFLLILKFTRNITASLAGSLFFAIHPANTESVIPAVGLNNLLALFFYLMAVIAFILLKIRHWLKVMIISVLYFVAVCSRETAITLPLILYLYDVKIKKNPPNKLLYSSLIITALVYFFLRTFTTKHLVTLGLWYYNIFCHIGIILKSFFLSNIPTILFPINNYPCFHSISLGHSRIFEISLFIIAAALVILLWIKTRKKLGGLFYFAIAWIFINLLPSHNLMPADRFLYFSIAGAGMLIATIAVKIRSYARMLPIAIILIFLPLSYSWVLIWRSDFAIISEMRVRNPDDYWINNNLGYLYYRHLRLTQTGYNYSKLAIKDTVPNNHRTIAHVDMGLMAMDLNKSKLALHHFCKAVKINPHNWRAFMGLYKYHKTLGEDSKALRFLQYALNTAVNNNNAEISINPVEKKTYTDTFYLIHICDHHGKADLILKMSELSLIGRIN